MQGRITSAPVPSFCSWPSSFINTQRDPVTFRCTPFTFRASHIRDAHAQTCHTVQMDVFVFSPRGSMCLGLFSCSGTRWGHQRMSWTHINLIGTFLFPSSFSLPHTHWMSIPAVQETAKYRMYIRPRLENRERVHFEGDLCSCACSLGRFRSAALSVYVVDFGLNSKQTQTVHVL